MFYSSFSYILFKFSIEEDEKVLGIDDGDIIHNGNVLIATGLYT